MRIAIDSGDVFERHTGARTYLVDLLPELLKVAGGNDQVSVFYQSEVSSVVPEPLPWLTRHENFRAVRTPFAGAADPLWRKARFPSIEQLRGDGTAIDVNHALALPTLPSRASKTVLTLYSVTRTLGIRDLSAKPRPRKLEKKLNAVDKIIVPSRATLSFLGEFVDLNNVHAEVIYPGVHQRYLDPPKPSLIEDLFERYPFLQEPYLLTLGGSTDTERNVPFLLECCERARQSVASVPPLVIVAPLGQAGEIVRQIAAGAHEGNVFIVQDLDAEALPAVYRGAEFVFEPANQQAFGQSLLEAAACGVPALAHPGCGALEIVGDGALRPEAAVNAWAASTIELHRSEATRERLGEAGQSQAREYTWLAAAKRHWDLYAA